MNSTFHNMTTISLLAAGSDNNPLFNLWLLLGILILCALGYVTYRLLKSDNHEDSPILPGSMSSHTRASVYQNPARAGSARISNKHDHTQSFSKEQIDTLTDAVAIRLGNNFSTIIKNLSDLNDKMLSFEKLNANLRAEKDRLQRDYDAERSNQSGLMAELSSAQGELAQAKSTLEAVRKEFNEQKERKAAVDADLEATRGNLVRLRQEFEDKSNSLQRLEDAARNSLTNLLSRHILDSDISKQIEKFHSDSALGDECAIRVMAALFQLRSSILSGSSPDDSLIAVKALGAALHSAWSAKAINPKAAHAHFVEWQNVLNNIPGVGFQLVVPDLGQSVTQNITAPQGVTKVSEVVLWIVKSANGSVYARGIVR